MSNKKLFILFKKVLSKIISNNFKIKKVCEWNKKKYTKKFFNEKFATLEFKINKVIFDRYIEATDNKKLGYPIIKINNRKFKLYED